MGQYVQIEENGEWKTLEAGKAYDFSTVRKIRVKNDSFGGVITEYTVTITAELSSECKILGYKIGYAEGEIDEQNHTVTIEVPYGTDLTKQTAEVTCSEFAENTIKPGSLAYNMDLTYVIKAENGATQKYTVRIKQTAPATGKNILSFSYGSVSARIGENALLLEVPFSVDLKSFAPTILVSEFATVKPASGEAVDFTNSEKTPVTYTVRAQDGSEKTYKVTVKNAKRPDSVPYGDILEEVKENILADYKSRQDGALLTDDWILMNLGFATCTEEVTSGDELPYGLDLYGHIKELRPNVMTDYGRIIISKKVVKNTGQLPKYLIQNHHAGIVTREQFQAVQAELARRSALRSNSKQAATGRSCYTSKYALSDRLVCGECGKLYRRKTRNIKGNIYHEWRCISRLDYGKRYCHNSPTLREIPLQNAILAAINEAMSEKPVLLDRIKSAMSLELLPVRGQTMSLADIDRRLEQLDAQFQQLLAEAIDAEDKERCNAKFAEILAEQTELKTQKEHILQSSTDAERTCARLVQAEQALEQAAPTVTEWNESTVRQLVERVTVLSANEVLVQLKGGKEIRKRLE